MQIGLLGPLEVQGGEVQGARLRTLLTVLALEPGRVVPAARLVDGIWGVDPPAGAVNALQALVSRLRRALPLAVVESHPAGYRLVVEPDAVDVARFERLAAAGRGALAEDAAMAARLLGEALALWRGPALVEVAEQEFFRGPAARLEELRLAALQDRVDAELTLGRGAALTTELAALVAAHPVRERLVAALMRALCAAGRSAEALEVYQRAREALAETLGVDPSPELSTVHIAVLRGELDVTSQSNVDDESVTNLRVALTSFVGRDSEVAAVGQLVSEYRLTTLTGPGGAGKTRLAVEAARTLLGQLPDGVWLVELAPVGTAAEVPQAVLAALGIRDQGLAALGSRTPGERLAAALRGRNTLLVLDNCEHVIDAAAALADQLLGQCPRLRILATSREPLGITGEALWPVEPLALPPPDADGAEAMSYSAVRLLSDRAGAARPGFAVAADTVAAVRICRALDGMPLAIELAAARLRTMTAEQLAARLDDRFRLLTGGSRTALPRHQTLRAVIDWSWELLSDQERTVLRRLAVFSGGATLAAAEQVCADSALPADQVLELLGALVDKSLLVVSADAEPRYRMLETIKAYGLERLDEAGERERIRQAHAGYFAALAETADPHLRRADQLVWLGRLEVEHDNLNSALRGAIAAGAAPTAFRLVAAVGWYWWLSGHRVEGTALAAKALALPGVVDDQVRAVAYAAAAWLAMAGIDDELQAREWVAQAHEIVQRTECRHPLLRLVGPLDWVLPGPRDPAPVDTITALLADEEQWVRGGARLIRARTRRGLGQPADAEADLVAALAEFRGLGERWGISFCLTSLAELVGWRGELNTAAAHHEEAIRVATELGASADVMLMRLRLAQLRWQLGAEADSAADLAELERDAQRLGWADGLAVLAQGKAELARWSGDLDVARTQLTLAEAGVRDSAGSPYFPALIRGSRGYLLALEGDLDVARAEHAAALGLALDTGDAPLIAQALTGVADLALHRGDPAEAARLLGAGAAVRGTPDRSHPDEVRVRAAALAALGEAGFAEAAQRGQGATVVTVREFAVAVLGG